jgi:AmmeMemoRadiSam system protein B
LSEILGPEVAGSWYPSDPHLLGEQLDRFMGSTSDEGSAPKDVAALIAPHAGYAYSGDVAGKAFRWLRGSARSRVILLGPSHRAAFRGAVLPTADAYRTPLGDVPIDTETVRILGDEPGLALDDRPFQGEHGLEMEIPFLQRALDTGWRLVPLLVGGLSTGSDRDRLGRALARLSGPDTLVVVSSDFTHYGPHFGYTPFRDDLSNRIRDLDMGAIERIVALDHHGFDAYVHRTGATICGRMPIDVLLHLLPEGHRGELLAYDTSGRITGDWSHTVSYASLLFHPGDA